MSDMKSFYPEWKKWSDIHPYFKVEMLDDLLREWQSAQQGVQSDCSPCGHPKEAALQMEFGSWSCQMCKAANSR